MTRPLSPADTYRAVYLTLFRWTERHDLRRAPAYVNDNPWHPLGAA